LRGIGTGVRFSNFHAAQAERFDAVVHGFIFDGIARRLQNGYAYCKS
jgi:hypothetical protein